VPPRRHALGPTCRSPGAAPGLAEQLAGRELEVLVLLAAGMPNPHRRGAGGHPRHGQKHVSHLLGKLGSANRTEAVARARQLGLFP
jgi:LuxR family maltose regulon positive regulatory protein